MYTQGIDWSSIDSKGTPIRPETLTEYVAECEPSDVHPPGAAGPPTATAATAQRGECAGGGGAAPAAHMVMVCVGRAGTLGGVWRSPPLALSEYTTNPTETLQVGMPFKRKCVHGAGLICYM